MRNLFIASITISAFIHAGAIFGIPNLQFKPLANEIKKIREIHLIKNAPLKQNTLQPAPPKYIPINAQTNLQPQNAQTGKVEIAQQTAKAITLSDDTIAKDLKKIPAYANYYHLIRDKIRAKAFSYYDSSAGGEMYLVFTVSSDGKLISLGVKEGESLGSEFLRQIAIESIKDASPFPEFPEELKKYERLQFSISISFKND